MPIDWTKVSEILFNQVIAAIVAVIIGYWIGKKQEEARWKREQAQNKVKQKPHKRI